MKEIITTQMEIDRLSRYLQAQLGLLNYLKDDDKKVVSIKQEIGNITSFLIKQGVEIKNVTSQVVVLKFIEVRLNYVEKELRNCTKKTFFYLEAGALKPISDYGVFEKEIMDNPDIVKCFEQIVEAESEDE